MGGTFVLFGKKIKNNKKAHIIVGKFINTC